MSGLAPVDDERQSVVPLTKTRPEPSGDHAGSLAAALGVGLNEHDIVASVRRSARGSCRRPRTRSARTLAQAGDVSSPGAVVSRCGDVPSAFATQMS